MAYAAGVRVPQTAFGLLQPVLVERLPAAVIALQEQVIIRRLRALELAKLQVLAPLAPVDDEMHEIGGQLLPQVLRVPDDGQFPVQKLPDLRGQLKMLCQEPQQLQAAVLFLLQGEKDVIVKKLLPEPYVLSRTYISIDFSGPLQPEAGGRSVPGLLRLRILLFLFRVSAGLLVGLPQPLEPLGIVLRIRHSQPAPVGILDLPFLFCRLDSQYLESFRPIHVPSSTCHAEKEAEESLLPPNPHIA